MINFIQKSHVNVYSNLILTILFSSYLIPGNLNIVSNEKNIKLDNAKLFYNEVEYVSPKGISSLSSNKVVKVNNTTKKYVSASYDKVTGENVVSYAKLYLGLRYVNGGNSLSTGTDCSGFTKLIYKEFGYTLSRGVKSQAKNGTYIRKSDLKPGDLVFYGYGDGVIHHVGIYIGDGKVIHESTKKDGVKISSVNMLEFITARRIITSKATKTPTISETNLVTNTDVTETNEVNENNTNTENSNDVSNENNVVFENVTETNTENTVTETIVNNDNITNTENVVSNEE